MLSSRNSTTSPRPWASRTMKWTPAACNLRSLGPQRWTSPFRRARSADYLNLSLSGDTGADYLDDPLLEKFKKKPNSMAHKRNKSQNTFGVFSSHPSDQNLHRRDVSHSSNSSSGDTMKKIVSVPAFSEYV